MHADDDFLHPVFTEGAIVSAGADGVFDERITAEQIAYRYGGTLSDAIVLADGQIDGVDHKFLGMTLRYVGVRRRRVRLVVDRVDPRFAASHWYLPASAQDRVSFLDE